MFFTFYGLPLLLKKLDLQLTAGMLAAMKSAEPRAASTIGTLVNTHANGDHCNGNELVVGAEIISSEATAEEMRQETPAVMVEYLKAAPDLGEMGEFFLHCFGEFEFEGITQCFPTTTYNQSLERRVGDKRVQLLEVGPAHTAGDTLKLTWLDGGKLPPHDDLDLPPGVRFPRNGCMFHGEKGTTWEGGHRVPQVIRWPGVIEPGTVYNSIISHEDWLPTFLAAAGDPDIKEKLKKGHRANGKEFKVHLDGYNFMPFFKGDVEESPREEIIYFGQGGELNAIRVDDWKIHFATIDGNIATGVRRVAGWPLIINLRADPYEKMPAEGEMGYLRWYADNMWTFVPAQAYIKSFLETIPDYPFQAGSSLNAAGINYGTLKQMEAMERLQQLETISRPNN